MTKLKDILGELMPINIEDPYGTIDYSEGVNNTIDYLEKITLEVDEEKLKDILCKINFDNPKCEWFKFIKTNNGDWHLETMLSQLTSEINKSLPTILIARKES